MEYNINMNTKQLSEIYKLRVGGMTYQQIGDRLGLSRQRIHQILTRYSTKKRKNPSYNQRVYLKYKLSIGERSLERKRQVLTHYGNGKCACVLCGFDDIRALSIDHIASNGSQETNHGTGLYYKLIKKSFPSGYQTLCMNCQWIKRNIRREISRKGRPNTTHKYKRYKGKNFHPIPDNTANKAKL